jgi:hypothetical protein
LEPAQFVKLLEPPHDRQRRTYVSDDTTADA